MHPTTLVPNSQDLDNQAIGGDTWTRGETLNLTWQATPEEQDHDLRPLQPAAGRLQPVQRHHLAGSRRLLHAPPRVLLQPPGRNPYTNKLLFEGGFTFYNERWIFGPEPDNINGFGPDAIISKIETSLGILYGAANVFTTAGNHQYNMRAAANYVTGSHAFKVGMQDMWGTRHYRYDTNQAQAWTFSAASRRRSPSTRGRSSTPST